MFCAEVSGSPVHRGMLHYLDNTDKTDQRRDGFRGEVTGKESPKECKTLATPRVQGTFPLGLEFGTLERPPEGVELEGEEQVDDRTGNGYEESDRSSRTEVPNDLRAAPASEGIQDGPGQSRHLLPRGWDEALTILL